MAPNQNQRIDQLEQELDSLRASISEQVMTAMNCAAHELQQTLAVQIATSLEKATARLGEDLKILASKVEGRISSTKENQEMMITQIRDEVRDTLSTLKTTDHTLGNSGYVGANAEGRGREETGGGWAGGGNQWRCKKLDLPLFSGTNPDGWILRAERYFDFYRLGEEEKLEAAVVALEGDALLWYQYEHKRRPLRRWEEIRMMILRQFRSTSTGTLYEQWLDHQQEGSVADYQRKFIELMAPLDGVPEEIAKGQFINGLKGEVRAEVRLLGPTTLDQAMDLALKVDEKIKAGSTHQRGSGYGPFIGRGNYTAPTISNLSPQNYNPVRQLSEKELQQKREQGLCFRCDEKWSINHRCRTKELSVLLTREDEAVLQSDESLKFSVPEEFEKPGSDLVQTEVSLNSVMAQTFFPP